MINPPPGCGWTVVYEQFIPNNMIPTHEELFGSWALVLGMDPVDLGRCMLVRSYPSFLEVDE